MHLSLDKRTCERCWKYMRLHVGFRAYSPPALHSPADMQNEPCFIQAVKSALILLLCWWLVWMDIYTICGFCHKQKDVFSQNAQIMSTWIFMPKLEIKFDYSSCQIVLPTLADMRSTSSLRCLTKLVFWNSFNVGQIENILVPLFLGRASIASLDTPFSWWCAVLGSASAGSDSSS